MARTRVSPEEFTKRLVHLVQVSGLTGRALAKAAPVSNSTVNGWLHGTLPKNADELRRAVEVCLTAARRRDQAVRLGPWDTADRWVAALALAVQSRDTAPPPSAPASRTATGYQRPLYVEQVKRIAPPRLIGREAELAELAAFCTQESGDPYAWWQAGPWAGKSALLSTFVLGAERLLPPSVRLISYFVTARLAGQDTRESFTTALLDQLCTMTGQDVPAAVDVATREATMLRLLDRAAAACRADGGRLILLVDGLDEERRTDFGSYPHSIAGLLPAAPPDGMRIVLASRPNPPAPSDVLDGHPLRDSAAVRRLTDSEHAGGLRQLAQRELRRLLTGSQVEQDVLGLITVARGGLTTVDLRELTGAGLVAIDDVVHTAAGRTFLCHDDSAGYALGHEELHRAAVLYIGADRLTNHRDRLDAWADRYRHPADPDQRPWPASTPPYLLWNYAAALADAGDADRLVVLATDPARHDRMLDESGADTAALAEIRACQDLLLEKPEPDLYALSLLSYHRHRLETRTTNIPVLLPSVWASLGQGARAEALARSIVDVPRREEALAELARAVAGLGDYDHAVQTTRLIDDPYRLAQAATDVVKVAAAAGDHDWMTRYAHGLTDPQQRADALRELAWSMTRAGDYAGAVRVALFVDDEQMADLVYLAGAMAEDGESGHARTLAADIGRALRGSVVAGQRPWILVKLADAMAAAGDHDGAERIAADITDQEHRAAAWDNVVRRAAEAGELDRAEQLSRRITGSYRRSRALSQVAKAMVHAGDPDRAEQIAHRVTNPTDRSAVLAELVGPIAEAGGVDRAKRIARTIPDQEYRARALGDLSRVIAEAGEYDRGEEIARGIDSPYRQAWALAALARKMAGAGLHDRAERLARSIDHSVARMDALADLAVVAAHSGNDDRARATAAEARRAASGPRIPVMQARVKLARLAVRLGEPELARALVSETVQAARPGSPSANAQLVGPLVRVLTDLAVEAVRSGDHERVRLLAADADRVGSRMARRGHGTAVQSVALAVAEAGDHQSAEQIVRGIRDPSQQMTALGRIAEMKAGARDYRTAEQIAGGVTDPDEQARVLASLARIAVQNTDHEPARELAVAAERTARTSVAPTQQAQALAVLVAAVAEAGDHTRAEQIARGITMHYPQAMALTSVARAVAASGDRDHATRIAGSITDRYAREHALDEVAPSPENGRDASALSRRDLATALATGPWWAPLPLLAARYPDVVLRLAVFHLDQAPPR